MSTTTPGGAGPADSAVCDELAKLGTATVYEASGRQGLVDIPLIQVTPGSRACGPARIAACGQDDNLAVHAVMERVEPGDVLVLTMPDPTPVALFGEILATQAVARGAAAVLVDGAVRDVETLREMDVPVWARFVRVAGAVKACPGALDVEVRVGGAAVSPGDLLVLDADGAVAVPAGRAGEVAEAASARAGKEAALRPRLQHGELTYDIHGLRAQP